MHQIEPFYLWQDVYDPADDPQSPFHGNVHSEFTYTNAVYDHFIHPQWDEFGSPSLYVKLIWADYANGSCILEFLGEWNDCIHNDIMHLKRNVVDVLIGEGINRFVLIGENVLNFHADGDDYYEEWFNESLDEGGWVVGLNFRDHVLQDFSQAGIDFYITFGGELDSFPWRGFRPNILCDALDALVTKRLGV